MITNTNSEENFKLKESKTHITTQSIIKNR